MALGKYLGRGIFLVYTQIKSLPAQAYSQNDV